MIYPCLWFDGNAIEAAQYYTSIFDHSKITTDTPVVVQFEIENQKIMGLNGGPMFTFNPAISLFVTIESEDKLKNVYERLLDGGSAMMPMGSYPWAEMYGWITDKFGLSWQLMKAENPAKDKIAPCLLFVDKVYGRGNDAIHFYQSVFKHSTLYSISHYDNDPLPKGMLKHAHLGLEDFSIRAMDGAKEHSFSFNESISMVVTCKNQEEIDSYWFQLTANGGEESMCGWCRDPFGVSWQIIPENIQELLFHAPNGPKAMEALMKMQKIDIEKLQNPS